jgi:Flp pilus assembly protein TadB
VGVHSSVASSWPRWLRLRVKGTTQRGSGGSGRPCKVTAPNRTASGLGVAVGAVAVVVVVIVGVAVAVVVIVAVAVVVVVIIGNHGHIC